jgi:hypothetical protein
MSAMVSPNGLPCEAGLRIAESGAQVACGTTAAAWMHAPAPQASMVQTLPSSHDVARDGPSSIAPSQSSSIPLQVSLAPAWMAAFRSSQSPPVSANPAGRLQAAHCSAVPNPSPSPSRYQVAGEGQSVTNPQLVWNRLSDQVFG